MNLSGSSRIGRKWWIDSGIFRANAKASGRVFSLVIPPPNVTGSLHIGHMLEHTEIDVTIRWHRMLGDNTLWLPGTDHAGIATQMVVARQLAEEGDQLPRPRPRRIRKARLAVEGRIRRHHQRQMVRLGASCDWSRERFTLDPGLSRAVREVFVRLYEKGLIYRGEYMINWCPALPHRDLRSRGHPRATSQSYLWHIRYPVVGEPGRFLTVATTRPETMLGDTAVAINPKDERYHDLHGKTVMLPLMDREIPDHPRRAGRPRVRHRRRQSDPRARPRTTSKPARRHNLPKIQVIDDPTPS